MIPEQAFERLLGLDECWAVVAAEYETEPVERFFLVLRETDKLWPKLRCPVATCGHPEVVCHDHTEGRVWRHLDAFGKRTEVLCAPPHRLGLLRDIDHTTTAFADPLQQLIAPQRLAHGFVGSVVEVELDGEARGFGLRGQRVQRRIVRCEQGFEALAQRCVAFAHGVEKRGALLGLLLQRQGKEGFFAGGVHRGRAGAPADAGQAEKSKT